MSWKIKTILMKLLVKVIFWGCLKAVGESPKESI
ncbi:hypothetical protein SPLC1_S081090 [Arthrospira platensis C1]|nr:hypothetical protein SPLC1_S081090 [Arthrospira platensis C1]